jgi:hypothetical protein
MDNTTVFPGGFPPIPEHRKAVYDYYRLTFDDNGCPMKQTDSGMVFHPLLPAYLMVEYCTLFQKTKDKKYVDSALRIADLSLQKAVSQQSTLVFLYHAEDALSYVPGTYYSALTQSWYIKALSCLSPWSIKRGGSGFERELSELFGSLLIPVESGGVLMQKDYGWIVEEYPQKLPLYTLNGWLTVIRIIIAHHHTLSKLILGIDEFLEKNLRAIEKLLPLYDAGFCYNSRYQLSGFTRIKLVFDRPVECRIKEAFIRIPGEGDYSISSHRQKSRWENYLERQEGRIIQFNVVLSLISYPHPNRFLCQLNINQDCKLDIFLADGDYRPDSTALPTQKWRQVKTLNIFAGDVSIDSELPFDGKDLFAYPTNFKKEIGGVKYNAYHFVHIIDLVELYSYNANPVFKKYALRWLGYINEWSGLKLLQEGGYSLEPHSYGRDFSSIVQNRLESGGGGSISFPNEI